MSINPQIEAVYTDDDIDMTLAGDMEYVACAVCNVDIPVDQEPTVNPKGHGYLCPFCDGTFTPYR